MSTYQLVLDLEIASFFSYIDLPLDIKKQTEWIGRKGDKDNSDSKNKVLLSFLWQK